MNKEDTIRMAIKCELVTTGNREGIYMDALARFAALVAAAEREACALVCEALPATCTWMDYDEDCMECARAIRARGGE